MTTDYTNYPHPLHSVATVGIVWHNNQVLLIRRADNDLWEPPAGILEFEDDPETGVAREVKEETGIDVKPVALAGVHKEFYGHPMMPVTLIFKCGYIAGKPTTSPESSEVRWVPLDEAKSLVREAHMARIYDAVDYPSDGPAPHLRAHDGNKLLPKC
ncbi:NUDIX hydrolase [Haloglycomyces albus]|uniref:NUDIX hydrolase n=1 Tax=Haloglycomyces albus TaxID=526067 RepID=UPI00046D3C2E|nr:NUDIX domain-containing protein [Haloglycomyces albus]